MVFLPDRREDDPSHKHSHSHHGYHHIIKMKDVRNERAADVKADFKDRISILAVAYHSLGVE